MVVADDWKSFLSDAQQLLKNLEGTAALKSMSPDAMGLILEFSKKSKKLRFIVKINSLELSRARFPQFALHLEDEIDSEWFVQLENSVRTAYRLLQ